MQGPSHPPCPRPTRRIRRPLTDYVHRLVDLRRSGPHLQILYRDRVSRPDLGASDRRSRIQTERTEISAEGKRC